MGKRRHDVSHHPTNTLCRLNSGPVLAYSGQAPMQWYVLAEYLRCDIKAKGSSGGQAYYHYVHMIKTTPPPRGGGGCLVTPSQLILSILNLLIFNSDVSVGQFRLSIGYWSPNNSLTVTNILTLVYRWGGGISVLNHFHYQVSCPRRPSLCWQTAKTYLCYDVCNRVGVMLPVKHFPFISHPKISISSPT